MESVGYDSKMSQFESKIEQDQDDNQENGGATKSEKTWNPRNQGLRKGIIELRYKTRLRSNKPRISQNIYV